MKIIVIGANGQLGSDLVSSLKSGQLIPLTHADVEISDFDSVSKMFEKYKPQIVINTAAFHNVPECEKNDVRAFAVNGLGPKYLAQNCVAHNCMLLHISTDYVFDGKKNNPYLEDDIPNPLNVYGISKLTGEYYIKSIMEKYIIVRTSGLYGIHKCRAKGGNFVDTMLKLSKEKEEIKVVCDEFLTPTYTLDLANQITELVKTDSYGLYHVTNEGFCSWYEFAKAIFDILDIRVSLREISHREFYSGVKRPPYSVLENGRLKSLGINKMRHWKDALQSYLLERKKLNLL